MVAIISATARTANVISYNQEKVNEGKAVLLHSKNFLQDTARLTKEDMMERFQRLHELNPRSEVNTVHITLNFAPQDQLSRKQFAEIADKYMDGVKMGGQPYLVYQHHDAPHPHLHIVSSLIKPEGERLRTHNIAKNHSESVRKSLEIEYKLTPGAGRKEQDPRLQLTTDKISRAVDRVTTDYRFSSMEGYAAVLRTYHVAVGGATGSPENAHRRGLYYTTTDKEGKKNSPPITGKRLGGKATLAEVQTQIDKGKDLGAKDYAYVRQNLDWTLRQQPETGFEFVVAMRKQGIDMVMEKQPDSNSYRVTYVDHQNKIVVPEEKLGNAYAFKNLVSRITQNNEPTATPEKKKPEKPDQQRDKRDQKKDLKDGPSQSGGFQVKGQTVLAFLMKPDAQFSPSGDLDEDPELKTRKRQRL